MRICNVVAHITHKIDLFDSLLFLGKANSVNFLRLLIKKAFLLVIWFLYMYNKTMHRLYGIIQYQARKRPTDDS
jgi:hypothetical protein